MATVTQIGPRLGIAPTCAALGLPRATYYRRRRPARAAPPRRRSPRALGEAERAAVLEQLHAPRFVDLAPGEVYATLLDEGRYLCSERTMYRVLAAHAEVRERRAAPASHLCRPGAAGPPAQRALELGHHEASRAREVDLLLPVRHARRLQPLRGGLDGGASRERDAGRAVHSRNLCPPRHRPRAAHGPRRSRVGDDLEARRPVARGSRRHQDAWPAARVERQPVLRGPVQDAEVPSGVPGAVRLDPGRPSALSRLLPLVQHRAPSRWPRPAHTGRRAPRPGRAARRRARDRARHRLCGPSRAVSRGPSGPGADADRGLDQSPQAQRARGGGAYSLNSRTGCLILVDRLRRSPPSPGNLSVL